MKKMIIVIVVYFLFFSIYGCKKQQPTNPNERETVLNAEKVFISAIITGNKEAFGGNYASNDLSQSNAELHYTRFALYRELYSLVTTKFGQEGWKMYQSFEYGTGWQSYPVAELSLVDIDGFLQNTKVEFIGRKAIVNAPGSLTMTYRKENDHWVFDVRDNPKMQWDKKLSEKINDAYRAAIKEANSPDATIESIKMAYENSVRNDGP